MENAKKRDYHRSLSFNSWKVDGTSYPSHAKKKQCPKIDTEASNLQIYIELNVASSMHRRGVLELFLSFDVASGSDIAPCKTNDKPLVVYRFSNVT